MRILLFFVAVVFIANFANAKPNRERRNHFKQGLSKQSVKNLPPIRQLPVSFGDNPLSILSSAGLGKVPIGTTRDYYGGWKNDAGSTHTDVFQTLTGSGFTMISDTCTGTMGPYTSCHYTIRFSPTSAGSYSAGLTISYKSGGYWDSVDKSFQGQGYDPAAYDPDPSPLNKPAGECGSIINVDSQSVAETVSIVGTPYSLWYSTEFMRDFQSPYNTKPRYNQYNPEGFSVSVHHMFDFTDSRLFRGTGSVENVKYGFRGSEIWVVSSAGDEIYVFDFYGTHLETKTFFTGATKYLFEHDSEKRLTKITDAFGNETLFNRTSGVLSSITAPKGQVTTITTNSEGLISEIKNPALESYLLTYKSGTDLLQTFTKPGGQVTNFSYNAQGKLTKDLGNGGNFWDFAMTLGSYDRLVSQTSKLGREKRIYNYQYEDYGGSARWTETPSDVRSEHIEYGNGSYTEYDDTTGNTVWTTRMSSDPRFSTMNNPLASEGSWISGNQSETFYNQSFSGLSGDFGFTAMTETKTTSGRTTTTVFNNSTKTFTTTSPEGAISYKTINSYEQPISNQVGLDTAWTYSYDSYGRLSGIAQGSKNSVTNTYNTEGFLSTITNARSEQMSYAYDLAGRVTQVTLPDSRVVGYSYDDNGTLVGVTPPSRPEHIFGFNAFELMETYEPPTLTGLSVKDTTYTYNNDKQLTSVVRPDGQSAGYTYNGTTGLLSSLNLARGNTNYTYQYRSELVSRSDSADGISSLFTYYGENVLSESQKRSSDDFLYAKIDYGFDVDHRRVSRTLRGNSSTPSSTITTTLNDDNMPTQIGAMTLAYSYPSGRLSSTELGKISDSRTYDSYGNLSSYTAIYTPTSGPLQTLYSYTLTRDVMSRISSKSETVLGVTDVYDYSYDTAGRLTTVLKNSLPYSSYSYDNNGNRTSGTHAGTAFTATFDDQDRMLTYNSQVYSYNANGDNTQIDWNTTETSYFSYDALGSLIGATMPNATVLSFSYDGVNRLVRAGVDGVTAYRRIYQDKFKVAAEYNDSGSISKEFIFGTSINSPDYMTVSGLKYRYIRDHLGSPRLVVNVADGTIVQRLDYTEFGAIVSDTSPGFQPYTFAGGILEENTKLIKFGSRHYNPEVGRWTSKDPIRFAGGDTNLFGYVQNDPINFIDPNGRNPVIVAPMLIQAATLMLSFDIVYEGQKVVDKIIDAGREREQLEQNEKEAQQLVSDILLDEALKCKTCPCR